MSRRFSRLAFAVLFAALAGGCIIPGINDGDGQAAQDAPSGFGAVAPKRINPTQPDDVPVNAVQLSWTSVSGADTYTVYLGPDTNPPLLVTLTDRNYVVRNLPLCTTNYWRVVATDPDGRVVSSPTWSFRTRCP